MPQLDIRNVCVTYRKRNQEQVDALHDVSLSVEEKDFVVVLGASGCGKTTLLSLIAGFTRPNRGEVLFEGAPVRAPGADRGVVFQRHALIPWLNVLQNVTFGLKLQRVNKAERRRVAARNLALVGLDGFEGHRVYELSGGMQQRVGLARALTSNPKALLMDEPLGALDALTRSQMQELLLDLWRTTGKTIFFITHSVEEALFLGTRLLIMSPRPGRIVSEYALDFCHRFLEQRSARDIKSEPDFIRLREEVLDQIYQSEADTAQQSHA